MMVRSFLDHAGRDLRLACRTLVATPLTTLVAVASLALGIGANTAIFSLLNSLLLRTLPVSDPARLVLISDGSVAHVRAWSYPVWSEIRRRPELFARSAAWSYTQFNLAPGGETQFIDGVWASGSFFDTLGVSPLIGRTFSDADDRAGGGSAGPVAVISYGFWQRRFGGALDAVGRSITFDGVPFTIIGVTRPEFSGPEIGRAFDAIVPIASEPLVRRNDSFLDDSGVTFLTIIARLGADQTIDTATAGLRRVQPEIREATLGEIGRFGSRAPSYRYLRAPFVRSNAATGYAGARDLRAAYEKPLLTIMVVVALLLLIACVNVGNLLGARAVVKQHELSVRLALGASRWQLVRQLLAESIVLYSAGAALGLAVARWSSHLLVRLLSTPANTVFLDLSLDGRVLAFTLAVTVIVTIVFGTAPAFRASGAAPIDALKQHGRTVASAARTVLAGWSIVLQVTLSLMLVVVAGLFIRTFTSLANRPLGFEPERVAVVNLVASRASNDAAQRLAVYQRARDAVRGLPDVADAALSLTTPIGSHQFTPSVEISGVSDTRGPVWANLVSPGFFTTFGTTLVAGRDLTDRDRAGTPRVAIVNEAFARKFTDGASPIGRTLTVYPHTERTLGPFTIVGVVRDAVYASLRAPVPATFYLPLAQFDFLTALGIRSINLSVRAKGGDPMLLTKSVSAAVATVDPQIALTFRPLGEQVASALTQERLIAVLSGCFGALALLLAGLGLYGVTAHAVASRRIEIGIRMALGAPATRVVRLVLARTTRLVAVGVVAGAGISWWASRFVATLIYGLEPRDLLTLAGSIAVLAMVAVLAAWWPARSAVRTDPAVVLRES
jgi:predicted permease